MFRHLTAQAALDGTNPQGRDNAHVVNKRNAEHIIIIMLPIKP
jgi:hypothetical protein